MSTQTNESTEKDDASQPEQSLEALLNGMVKNALAAPRRGPIQPLEMATLELEDGRTVQLRVLATEDLNEGLEMLGGIEGVVEQMLVYAGATTETEADPMIEDLALTMTNEEPLVMTVETPRRSVRLVIVPREAHKRQRVVSSLTTVVLARVKR